MKLLIEEYAYSPESVRNALPERRIMFTDDKIKIENWGRGGKRYIKDVKDAGLSEPEFIVWSNAVRINVLRKKNGKANVPVNVPVNVPINVPIWRGFA